MALVTTIKYNVIVSVFSIRFRRPGVYQRLKNQAAERAESASGLGERLIDEGLRMSAHPGIVFRDGPAGRRSALAAGPDIWQVAALLRDLNGSLDKRHLQAAERLGLNLEQIRAASRYYAEFASAIDQEIEANEQAADRELAAWQAERRLLSG